VVSLILALVATRVFWRRWKYDVHKVPSPPGLPLIGHMLEFINGQPSHQFSQWIGHCLKQLGYPKLMRVDGLGTYALIVTDVDFIKDVMMSKTSPFPKMPGTDFAQPMLGYKGGPMPMLAVETPTAYVKAVRKIYATAFHTKNLKIAMPRLNKVMQKMISIIEEKREGGPIDVQPLFVKMTLDAIGVVAFDTALGGLDDSRNLYSLLLEAGYITRDRFRNPPKKAFVKYFPKSKEAQRQNAIIGALNAEYDRITTEILDRDDPSNDEEPMWFALRNLKDPDTNETIARGRLLSEVATVVIAGMQSTGHQLAWLLGLLACHPHVIDKLLEELEQHGLYGPDAKDVMFEDLGELTYLTAIIKEGMRIGYVITGVLGVFVPKDMTILGYRVPKGAMILCPGTRALHSEEMWGDPEAFRPERWLTGEDMSHKYSLGFSAGPRDCIGQRLAMLEMRLAIIGLVTRYQFRLEGDWKDLMKSAVDGLVIEAKDGVYIHVTPRPVTT